MTASSLPTVLFPIEIVAREFDSKLVTAAALARHGVRSIVGHKEDVVAIGRGSERVVWHGKAVFSDKSENHLADELIARKSPIVFMQDEGAMHPVNAWVENVLQKHYVERIRDRDFARVLFWGRRQRDAFVAAAGKGGNIAVVTGSPRFDLCLPSFAWMGNLHAPVTRPQGPYILACTRFTAIAYNEGIADPFRRKLNPIIWPKSFDRQKIVDLWFAKWRRDTHDFADFAVMLKELAKRHPKRIIILRPHPSESLEFYKQAFSAFPNVRVTREGGVLEWIRSAEVVVHSNCTTGVEAVLAGKPVVNFLPSGDDRDETDVEVAREAGTGVRSVAEAIETVDAMLNGTAAPVSWSMHARSMLNNIEEESIPKVVAETLAVISENGITASKLGVARPDMLRNVARRVLRRGAVDYVRSKRGAFDESYVRGIVEGYASGGSSGAKVAKVTSRLAIIEPA